jgi:chromosome partitioning protein
MPSISRHFDGKERKNEMIITVGGTKGGGGKTTLATNLAVMRAREGCDVLLIDSDPQGTASTFSVLRNTLTREDAPRYTSVRLLGEEIINSYMSLKSKYQDIVIDAGGRETDSHRAALGIADVALIPFQPSSFDVWELGKASKVVKEMKTMNPTLKAYTLINQADSRGSDNEAAAEYAEEVEGLIFIPQPIVARKAFRRAAASGLSVVELKPQDPKASEEMQALYEFAFGIASKEIKLVANER